MAKYKEKRMTEVTQPRSQHEESVPGMYFSSHGRQIPLASSFLHPISKCLLSTYDVPGTVLGSVETAVNTIDHSSGNPTQSMGYLLPFTLF